MIILGYEANIDFGYRQFPALIDIYTAQSGIGKYRGRRVVQQVT
jgi:hypothetical protein